MAHLIESFAYANQAPWHGLGIKIEDDITTDDMLIKAGLNWNINKEGIITSLSKQPVPEQYALLS